MPLIWRKRGTFGITNISVDLSKCKVRKDRPYFIKDQIECPLVVQWVYEIGQLE
jgi:hypothetical protein